MVRAPVQLLALTLASACSASLPSSPPVGPASGPSFAPRKEVVTEPVFTAGGPLEIQAATRLERITTAVPWPRGLVIHDDQLIVLARGRHRRSGGCDPAIQDRAGSLFVVDPDVAEPVVIGRPPSEPVLQNAELLAEPTGHPFFLWNKDTPPIEDTLMDRPYCTLAMDPLSQNLFICGFSGVDLPAGQFRKNATDSIHRYDLRTRQWHAVELHDPAAVPEESLGYVVSNDFYPHHDPATNPAPHGLLNGPDGATVAGHWLYAVGKDNHVLAQYDLRDIRRDAGAPAPASQVVFGDTVDLRVEGRLERQQVLGHSAVAAHEGYLYVGFRTSSLVLRFPLDAEGDVVRPLVGELVAVFEPWDAATGRSGNVIDLAFNSQGELFVSCAQQGRVWNVGRPDPRRVFDGNDQRAARPSANRPYIDLRVLTGNAKARVGNITFDSRDRLYVCSGNYDSSNDLAGVIYRASL